MALIRVIHADGQEHHEEFPDIWEGQREPAERLKKIVGGWIEFVWVEYKGKRTCMIVNEVGALHPLPLNREATKIYHTYPAKRDGITLDEAFDKYPHIYGDVAVLEGVTVA